jgi:hypothetical protein
MDPKLVQNYADRFITALERIAAAMEGAPVSAPPAPPTLAQAPPAAPAAIVEGVGSAPFSYQQLRDAVMAYQDSHGYAAAQAIVKEFGGVAIKDIDVKDYAAVMAKLV